MAYFLGLKYGKCDFCNAICHQVQILFRKLEKPWRCMFSATGNTEMLSRSPLHTEISNVFLAKIPVFVTITMAFSSKEKEIREM